MSDTVIKIQNLKKQYHLGVINRGTLTADLQSWWSRKRGKEDPNLKIGEADYSEGGSFYALDGINLEIKRGEAVGIIGSNGAGKSTLLKILSRVTSPTEGRVLVKGRINGMLEVGTGFHPELTGRENIYMNGAILGMNRKEIDAKVDDIIDFSECRQFIDTPVKRYSSGMYVKLAFAVSAFLDADIMVMDEVLAVGDLKFQEKCLGKMGDSSANDGKTILYVSHNMNTIRQLCSRCIVLNKGKIVFDGDVDEGIATYMNFAGTDLPSKYYLRDVKRPSLDHGNFLKIESFEFIDKEKAVYRSDEKIKFKISIKSLKNVDGLRIYMPLKYADSTPVGLAESMEFGYVKEGEERTVCFQWDVSNLVAGKYYFFLDLHVVNKYGTRLSYDHPLENIYFQISQNNDCKMQWHRFYWGSIRLNEVKVVETENE